MDPEMLNGKLSLSAADAKGPVEHQGRLSVSASGAKGVPHVSG